jgi:hypothetical protein
VKRGVIEPALEEAVLERSTAGRSRIHGEANWKSVAATALRPLDNAPGADPEVAHPFALFHDAARREWCAFYRYRIELYENLAEENRVKLGHRIDDAV